MREKEAYATLLAQVKKARKTYGYSNDGEAFVHVFVRAYFDCSDEDAASAAQVGVGGHDHGIDAFYADITDRTVHIIGGTMEEGSFGPDKLVDIERATRFLSSPLAPDVKPELRTIWNDHKECENDYASRYVLVILGTLNAEARRKLEDYRKEAKKANFEVDVFQREDVLTWISFPFSGRGPDVEFTIHGQPLIFAPAKLRSIMIAIAASELARTVRKNDTQSSLSTYVNTTGPRPTP